jgi:hypothetical protein
VDQWTTTWRERFPVLMEVYFSAGEEFFGGVTFDGGGGGRGDCAEGFLGFLLVMCFFIHLLSFLQRTPLHFVC